MHRNKILNQHEEWEWDWQLFSPEHLSSKLLSSSINRLIKLTCMTPPVLAHVPVSTLVAGQRHGCVYWDFWPFHVIKTPSQASGLRLRQQNTFDVSSPWVVESLVVQVSGCAANRLVDTKLMIGHLEHRERWSSPCPAQFLSLTPVTSLKSINTPKHFRSS